MNDPAAKTTFVNLLQAEIEQRSITPVVRQYRSGETIFSEGSPGDGLYAVLGGLVHIATFVSQTSSHSLGEFAAGDFFGEMSILNEAPRSATAIAKQDSVLLFVSRDQVVDLMERSPPLVFALLHAFSNRMRETNSRFVHQMIEAERLTLFGRFARSIVHDLKNPLSIILLAGDAAASERASPALREQAKKRMHQQVERLNHMLNELLRVSEGSTQHSVEPVSFAAYVAEIIEDTHEELASKKVHVETRTAVPDIVLPINSRRLNHVFYNLFGNAADIMPEGGSISLRFQHNEREIMTEVEDSGPGFPPGIVEKLFMPFFTHGKANGTGLGLSICKNIVEDHGGRIWPKAEAGHGAIFCFTLPLDRADQT
jgi:signal transduction histidine kinase